MPQIAQLSATYASQIFWALIFFGFVFFVIGRGFVPGVLATVANRDKQIADDLAAAKAARTAAEAAEEAWKQTAAKQRADAHALIAAAKHDATLASETRLGEAAAAVDARMAEADARLAAASASALQEIETVASEAAVLIAQSLAGLTLDADAARASVKEVLHG
ncbi:ATPase [Novosphingobium umbonatum]|uniref:ATPase n=1 Tax=Novosphingobium umbonatum TaxID=1908524 RepID=A0A3S2X247_9SPHN|nr:ATPase [Novosphingobium umbonatum]RVU03735.1 ATPase [Novosphingobium umbonatum]